MSFEEFIPQHAVSQGADATISILKQGVFGLNKAAARHVEGFDHVVLYFDRENRRIGFHPVSAAQDNSYAIRRNANNATQISGVKFLKNYALDYQTTKRYACHWDDKTQMLILNL